MKGKKADLDFVASFVQASVQEGVEDSPQIVAKAKQMIAQIDEEIKAVEEKKKLRSKLLDVISVLDEKIVPDKTADIKLLSFYELKHPALCQEICQTLKNKDTPVSQADFNHQTMDVKFCLKQLAAANIIRHSGTGFDKGERYLDYWQFIWGTI